MAAVHSGDRQNTGFSDGKYPTSTGAQVRSAIKLRHNGKGHSAGEVLSHCAGAISRLLSQKKISAAEAAHLRMMISHARQMDRAK